jgi:hypothetical protein
LNKRQIHFSKYDIAIFIDEHGKTRWSNLLRRFVENGSEKHISRQRLSDYLKELVDDGLVKKTVDVPALMFRMIWRAYPVYEVPKSKRNKIQEIRNKKEIYEFVDTADAKKLNNFKKKLTKLNNARQILI